MPFQVLTHLIPSAIFRAMGQKFVCYYRLSTDRTKNKTKGQTGLGLEAQKRAIHSYIESVDGEVIGEFKDIESGGKATRSGVQEAILLCSQEQATLIIHKMDRLSRDGYRIMTQLEDAKVRYIAADSPHDSEVIKAIKFSFAKDELKKISSRTKAALQELKAKGVKLGTPKNLTQEARKKGAEATRLKALTNSNNVKANAYASVLRKSGMSLREIAAELNSKGFKTSRGKLFNAMQVKRVIEMFID